MSSTFRLFGISHLLILASIPAITYSLVWLTRDSRGTRKTVAFNLGAFLLANELVWIAYNLAKGWVHFPYGLPLNLCDIVVWLTIIAAVTLRPVMVELAYYWGISGSLMAILTPDLAVPLNSYPGIYFFAAHGGVVITILFLVWGKIAAPRPGSVQRAFIWLNAYAAAIAAFDATFRTNYFYICEKPISASLLDYMGPWPLYIVTGEVFALGAFHALWLPFRKKVLRATG